MIPGEGVARPVKEQDLGAFGERNADARHPCYCFGCISGKRYRRD